MSLRKGIKGILKSSPHNFWSLIRKQIWPIINSFLSIRKRFINLIYRQYKTRQNLFTDNTIYLWRSLEVQEIKLLIFFDKNNLMLFKYDKNSLMFYVIKTKQFLLIFIVFKQFKNVSFKFWMLPFSFIFWFAYHSAISLQLIAIQWWINGSCVLGQKLVSLANKRINGLKRA